MSAITDVKPEPGLTVTVDRVIYWLSRHWILAFSLILGVYVGLPWLAPVLMHLGWTSAGNALYALY